jgi:hypothetical protein
MTLTEAIKKLDRETAIKLLLALVAEFPIVKDNLLQIFRDHFKGEQSENRD